MASDPEAAAAYGRGGEETRALLALLGEPARHGAEMLALLAARINAVVEPESAEDVVLVGIETLIGSVRAERLRADARLLARLAEHLGEMVAVAEQVYRDGEDGGVLETHRHTAEIALAVADAALGRCMGGERSRGLPRGVEDDGAVAAALDALADPRPASVEEMVRRYEALDAALGGVDVDSDLAGEIAEAYGKREARSDGAEGK